MFIFLLSCNLTSTEPSNAFSQINEYQASKAFEVPSGDLTSHLDALELMFLSTYFVVIL